LVRTTARRSHGEECKERGESKLIRSLAKDVRELLDSSVEVAADRGVPSDQQWTGPNAEHVRGQLQVHKKRLATIAGELEKLITGKGGDSFRWFD
jgi:hypothetical protein